jgi:hypothetical protein
MPDADRLRARLAAAGAEIPDDLMPLVLAVAGELVAALDRLLTLDLGDVEPFIPSRRLEDAVRTEGR